MYWGQKDPAKEVCTPAQFGSAKRKTHVDLGGWHAGVSARAAEAHGGRGGRCVRAVVHLRRWRRFVTVVATD
jgi:hypothetical protein